jgi:hypothetical protein
MEIDAGRSAASPACSLTAACSRGDVRTGIPHGGTASVLTAPTRRAGSASCPTNGANRISPPTSGCARPGIAPSLDLLAPSEAPGTFCSRVAGPQLSDVNEEKE